MDGNIRRCLAKGRAHYDSIGTLTGCIGSCIDITELKILQQQKDDFIAIASHELKTPVTTIKCYTQILERMLQQQGLYKEAGMMSRVDARLKRLTNLISDLLDVTKMSSGKLQSNDDEFDFNDVVRDLLEDLQRIS
ncbi:MAG: histidine kinase dimerization/phospho-acceptor domain-containing protein, partial [Ferruginibacter sp.]